MKTLAKIVFILTFICATSSLAIYAASDPLNFTRRVWQVQDGLPEDVIQAFAQTPDQYLWIGTTAGLVRFDGASFVTYDRRNVPELKEKSILCLLATRDGDLWIGTEGGGLLLRQNGVFRLFSATEGLTNGFIRSVQEDDQGRLWVGTDGGLFRVVNSRVERVDDTKGIPPVVVHTVYKDAGGRMWVGGTRVLRFDHDRAVEYQLKGELSQYRVKSILVAHDGTAWVGTVSGLYKLDSRNVDSGRPFQKISGIVSTVRTLWQGSDTSVWAGTIGEGVYVIQGEKQTRLRSPNWLPSNTVLSFYEDLEKNMWVGTQHGVLRLSKTSVTTIPLPGAADSDFGTVYQDANKDFWMASNRLFHIRGDIARQYDLPELSGVRVRNVFRDRSGGLWFGTDGSGVFRIFKGRMVHFTTREGLANNYIRAFLESRDESIWLATDFGISRYLHGAFTNYQMTDGLAYSNIRFLFEDHQGDIWIGTERGISHMRGTSFLQDEVTDTLKEEKVWSIDQDRDGGLWFGTRTNGLYRWKSGGMAHLTTTQGLVSDSIFQIVEDTKDRFWMSGPDGVSMVRRSELDRTATDPAHRLIVKLFGISEGIEMTQIYGGTQSAGVLAPDGVWFPSTKGLVRLSAADDSRGKPPPVVIDKVVVDGQERTPAASILLKPESKKIQFGFTAVSLRSPEETRFRYKLEGFDRAWTDSDGQRQAYYTNLSPGSYTFRVAAFKMDDPTKASETFLTISQEPYFYRTWWFVLCTLLVAGAMIWVSHLRKVRELRLRFNAVLEERGRVAREMHDTLIQGCVSVSTILEGVSSHTEGENEEQSNLLNYARVQLRLTLDDARRALWDLREDQTPSTEIGPLLLSLADEIATEAHAQILCEIVGTQYEIQTVQARELLMIVREALFNAVHHAGPCKIALRIAFDHHSIDIGINDDGKGFDPHAMAAPDSGHYGLTGMRERAQRMSGTFVLSSKSGEGTQLKFHIPCKPMWSSESEAAK